MTTIEAGPAQASLQRAAGVELIGEMAGSGYRIPPSLVRRADGQTIQLTPLLYATLREIDGRRTHEEVAAAVSEATDRTVSDDNVRQLAGKLRPLGLLVLSDGSQPEVKKRPPLLGLRFRYVITDPERTRRLTDPFRFLFRPWVLIPLIVAFAAVFWWVSFRKGLASAAYDAFERPGLLILVFVVTVLSAGFHEFGHAAAARYGGSTPGVMGFGLYLVWPAFYTDVTDSYRLRRGGRLRTDLGGLYFNAIVAVGITGVWLWLQYDALLLVVATQILQMLRQLAPLVRFDGYHVLADLTGVPDLYGRIKPTLLGMLPWRWRDPRARELKWWARIVVSVWVIVVVPLLIAILVLAVLALPRLIGSAWAALNKQQDVLATAWTDGDMVQAIARVLAMIAIVIPMAAIIYMLVRVARRIVSTAWNGTAGKPLQRTLVGVLGAAALAGIAYAWFPNGENYRPIEASERGTIGDIVYALRVESTGGSQRTIGDAPRPVAAARPLAVGQRGVMWALWDNGTPLPTKDSPQLALVLVPKSQPLLGGGGGGGYRTADTAESTIPLTITENQKDQGWVFPFDKPLAPEPGDNQALAVNYRSNTVVYEAAFAFVYATDGADAMNVNEAQAYASCYNCAAVAIAYQVVFVVDTPGADDNDTDPTRDTNDNVAVPQNLAGSLNYMCVNCMTFAYARQLFVTLDEPLSEDSVKQLEALWKEIDAYADAIEAGKVPLNEIAPQLEAYTKQIVEIVNADQPGTIPTPTASPTASPTPAPTAPSTAAATESPTAAPTESPTVAATQSPTASPSLVPTASPTTQAPVTAAPSSTTATATPTESSTSSPTTEPPMSFSPTDPATADPSSGTSSTSDPTSEPSGSTSDGSTSDGTATSP
jgi:putative peptide zinc metalloprotease protein